MFVFFFVVFFRKCVCVYEWMMRVCLNDDL